MLTIGQESPAYRAADEGQAVRGSLTAFSSRRTQHPAVSDYARVRVAAGSADSRRILP